MSANISNAQVADVLIYYAYTDMDAGSKGLSAFVIEPKNYNGVKTTALDKLGSWSSPTGEVFLDGTEVENLLFQAYVELARQQIAQANADLDLDDSWGIAYQLGFDIAFSERWVGNIDFRYISIEPDAEVNGEGIGDVEIDPFVASVMFGYRFGR